MCSWIGRVPEGLRQRIGLPQAHAWHERTEAEGQGQAGPQERLFIPEPQFSHLNNGGGDCACLRHLLGPNELTQVGLSTQGPVQSEHSWALAVIWRLFLQAPAHTRQANSRKDARPRPKADP